MLNHATFRVNESEHERAISEAEHRRTTALYHTAEYEVQRLQRELRRAIAKSRYDLKEQIFSILDVFFNYCMINVPISFVKIKFTDLVSLFLALCVL